MTISEYANKALMIDLSATFKNVIERSEGTITDLNREQLYKRGEDSEGNKLLSYSGTLYALEKNAMNASPGMFNPDLYYSGAFHRSFFVDATEEGFSIWATDEKTDDLVEKYGSAIMGLQENSLIKFVEGWFAEEFINSIKIQLAS